MPGSEAGTWLMGTPKPQALLKGPPHLRSQGLFCLTTLPDSLSVWEIQFRVPGPKTPWGEDPAELRCLLSMSPGISNAPVWVSLLGSEGNCVLESEDGGAEGLPSKAQGR